jgi:hypothetical protein
MMTVTEPPKPHRPTAQACPRQSHTVTPTLTSPWPNWMTKKMTVKIRPVLPNAWGTVADSTKALNHGVAENEKDAVSPVVVGGGVVRPGVEPARVLKRGCSRISASWASSASTDNRPSPYHLVAGRLMPVIGAGHRPMEVRCG